MTRVRHYYHLVSEEARGRFIDGLAADTVEVTSCLAVIHSSGFDQKAVTTWVA
jgi:hypothetical protein